MVQVEWDDKKRVLSRLRKTIDVDWFLFHHACVSSSLHRAVSDATQSRSSGHTATRSIENNSSAIEIQMKFNMENKMKQTVFNYSNIYVTVFEWFGA